MTWRPLVLAMTLSALPACGDPSPEPILRYTVPEETPADEQGSDSTDRIPAPSWVTVAPSDARLQYLGRVELSSTSAVFSHPGVSIKLHFKGDALELLLKDQGHGGETGTNYYQVTIDGQAPVKLAVSPSQTVYGIGQDLVLGEHTVEVLKLTESYVGPSELQGFRLHGQLLEPPTRPALRLEFIGDSITCGYGNEVAITQADNPTTGFHSVNENITKAYGSLTARNLGAEAQMVCYSGRGLYRNNTGSTTGTLPQLYDSVLPDQPLSHWSFARYTPDIVVINLGTNDFAPGVPDAARFTAAYQDFVTRLRGYYPQARIICTTSPMLSDWYPSGQNQMSTIRSWVSSVVKDFNDQGDARVHYLAFAPQSEPYGEDWHPSLSTSQSMATSLADFIRALK